MRIRRSARQCVTSFSHSWCVVSVHGVYPPAQAPRIVRHSGDGICWPLGAYFVSCAPAASKAIANAAARLTSLVFTGFSLTERCTQENQGFLAKLITSVTEQQTGLTPSRNFASHTRGSSLPLFAARRKALCVISNTISELSKAGVDNTVSLTWRSTKPVSAKSLLRSRPMRGLRISSLQS